MKISRINFVCLFLIFGFAYFLGSIVLLNQQPDALFGSNTQAGWQSCRFNHFVTAQNNFDRSIDTGN